MQIYRCAVLFIHFTDKPHNEHRSFSVSPVHFLSIEGFSYAWFMPGCCPTFCVRGAKGVRPCSCPCRSVQSLLSQIQTNITDIGTAQFRCLYLGPEQMATDPLSQGLNRATAAGRQSESPSICTSVENTALLCLLRCVMTQSTSYDSYNWYFSIGTGPHKAICSNLTMADCGQVCPCVLLTFSNKTGNNVLAVSSVLLYHKNRSIYYNLPPVRNTEL